MQLEALQVSLQGERLEVNTWKNKWAQESTKTDGIKRECMQIVVKCEEHCKAMQQQHLAALSQRDYLLQRCKETIHKLEARLAGTSEGGAAWWAAWEVRV